MTEERATYETEGIDEGGAKELDQAAGRPFDVLTLSRFDQLTARIRQLRDEMDQRLALLELLARPPDEGAEYGSFAVATEVLTNDFAQSPTRRVRVNIAKNPQGYTTDTTVEVTAHDDETDLGAEVGALLLIADTTARDEIDIRERIDAGDSGTRSRYRVPHDPPSP